MTQTRSQRRRRRESAGLRTRLRQVALNLPMLAAILALITPLRDAETPGIQFRQTEGGGGYNASLQWCPPVLASPFIAPLVRKRGPSKGLRTLQARAVKIAAAEELPAPPPPAPAAELPPEPDLPPPPVPFDRPLVPTDLLPPLPPPPPIIGGLIPPDISVPEPPPWLLLALGLAGLLASRSLGQRAPR